MEFYIRNTKLNEIQEEPFKTKEDAEKTIAELKEMFGDYFEVTTEKYVELKLKYTGSTTPSNPIWDYIVFFCTL